MKPKKNIKSLIVLGENGVGKTTILYNYSKNKEMSSIYKETIVADYFYKEITYKEETWLLNFWDTNGKERTSKGLPNNLYRNCNAIILLCSYDKKDSFETLSSWLEFIKTNTNNKQIPIVLLVNKSDLPKDKKLLINSEIKQFSEQNRIPSLEISSKYKSIEEGINLMLSLLSGDILNSDTFYGFRKPTGTVSNTKVLDGKKTSRSMSFVEPKTKKCC